MMRGNRMKKRSLRRFLIQIYLLSGLGALCHTAAEETAEEEEEMEEEVEEREEEEERKKKIPNTDLSPQ